MPWRIFGNAPYVLGRKSSAPVSSLPVGGKLIHRNGGMWVIHNVFKHRWRNSNGLDTSTNELVYLIYAME